MSPIHVPAGYRTVTPYLTVLGAHRLIEFLEQVFDAEQMHCETADDGAVVNAALRIGDSTIEVSEARPEWPPTPAALHVFVPDCDQAYGRAMELGATSLHEPADMPYGERSGAVTDPSGNNWYIATHLTGAYDV